MVCNTFNQSQRIKGARSNYTVERVLRGQSPLKVKVRRPMVSCKAIEPKAPLTMCTSSMEVSCTTCSTRAVKSPNWKRGQKGSNLFINISSAEIINEQI